MTAGNNGADKPENDDPFGYLYRSEGGEGGAPGPSGDGPAARQPGVPSTSYNQVRTVGERQYGQQAPQQVTARAYGQQNAHYAAPETLPGGDRTRSARPRERRPGPRRGPNPRPADRRRRGGRGGAHRHRRAMITATARRQGRRPRASAGPTAGDEVLPEPTSPRSPQEPGKLPKQDAATLPLGRQGGHGQGRAEGAQERERPVRQRLQQVGAVGHLDGRCAARAASTRCTCAYGVPGQGRQDVPDGQRTRTARSINMKNFANAAEGDLEKGWTNTYAVRAAQQGINTLMLSCDEGDSV